MSQPYNEQATPYQEGQSAAYAKNVSAPTEPYHPAPGSMPNYTPQPQHPSRGLRTGATIALTVLLAVVFG